MESRCRGYCFPSAVIGYAGWLDRRFGPGLRDFEDRPAEVRVAAPHGTVHRTWGRSQPPAGSAARAFDQPRRLGAVQAVSAGQTGPVHGSDARAGAGFPAIADRVQFLDSSVRRCSKRPRLSSRKKPFPRTGGPCKCSLARLRARAILRGHPRTTTRTKCGAPSCSWVIY